MSRVLTAKEICERSLRTIGAFPITESAPDGEQLREAMHWLDLVMANFAGSTRVFWLIPATRSLDLVPGQASYRLDAELGSDYPVDGMQFPVQAWLEDGAGNRYDVTIAARDTFEAVGKGDQTGHRPVMVYIDRMPIPTLRIWPVLPADFAGSWTVKLDVQTYAPNVAPSGVSGTQPSGSILHGFRQAWQMWLVLELAHRLGSGPIAKIGEQSLNRFEQQADKAKADLLAFENREHDTEPPIVQPYAAYSRSDFL